MHIAVHVLQHTHAFTIMATLSLTSSVTYRLPKKLCQKLRPGCLRNYVISQIGDKHRAVVQEHNRVTMHLTKRASSRLVARSQTRDSKSAIASPLWALSAALHWRQRDPSERPWLPDPKPDP